MPTYDYRCPACGHEFERFQRMSDDPVADCPECGESAERMLSGGAGFLLRGEGFYITDYRSEEYRKKAAAESKDASGAAPKTSEGTSSESGASGGSGDPGGSSTPSTAADE